MYGTNLQYTSASAVEQENYVLSLVNGCEKKAAIQTIESVSFEQSLVVETNISVSSVTPRDSYLLHKVDGNDFVILYEAEIGNSYALCDTGMLLRLRVHEATGFEDSVIKRCNSFNPDMNLDLHLYEHNGYLVVNNYQTEIMFTENMSVSTSLEVRTGQQEFSSVTLYHYTVLTDGVMAASLRKPQQIRWDSIEQPLTVTATVTNPVFITDTNVVVSLLWNQTRRKMLQLMSTVTVICKLGHYHEQLFVILSFCNPLLLPKMLTPWLEIWRKPVSHRIPSVT